MTEVTRAQLIAALQEGVAQDQLETARRMKSPSSCISRYAVATSRATADPSALLRGALTAPL